MPAHRHLRLARPGMRIAGAVLALCAGTAGAQEAGSAAGAAPLYQVEIIVFRNLGSPGRPEDPGRPPVPPPLTPDQALERGLDASTPMAATEAIVDFTPTEANGLREAYARLRRSSAYRPVLHESWIQAGVPKTQSRPVDLQRLEQVRRASGGASSATGEAPLAGEVTLYQNRYLHLEFDLALAGADGQSARLRGSRRVRGGELHYFDAPELGVLAMVTRYEP